MHCVWAPEESLRKIEITIPDNYDIYDILNFTEYDFDETTRTLSISVDNLKSNNYFGVVLTYPNIIEDIEKRDEVRVSYLDIENNVLNKLIFRTRIVRPKLELLRCPEEILVKDSTNPKDLINLEVLHKGFGTAYLNIDITHNGANISKADSLYFEVIRSVLEKIISSISDEKDQLLDGIELDEEILRKTAEKVLTRNALKNLPFDLDKEQINEVVEILRDETKREMVYRIIYSSFRSLLLAALLYYSEKHPQEDIQLLSGQIAADMKNKIDELDIRMNYYDSMLNDYPPIEAKIRVLDKRTLKDELREFKVPINVKWKKDVFELRE